MSEAKHTPGPWMAVDRQGDAAMLADRRDDDAPVSKPGRSEEWRTRR